MARKIIWQYIVFLGRPNKGRISLYIFNKDEHISKENYDNFLFFAYIKPTKRLTSETKRLFNFESKY